MKRTIIGYVRLEKKPPYKVTRKVRKIMYGGIERSEEWIEENVSPNIATKCEKLRYITKQVTTYKDRQPIWYVYKDTDKGSSWAFAKFYKDVPLEDWKKYPHYSGTIYEKK